MPTAAAPVACPVTAPEATPPAAPEAATAAAQKAAREPAPGTATAVTASARKAEPAAAEPAATREAALPTPPASRLALRLMARRQTKLGEPIRRRIHPSFVGTSVLADVNAASICKQDEHNGEKVAAVALSSIDQPALVPRDGAAPAAVLFSIDKPALILSAHPYGRAQQ